jgi:hypothetical protein
MVAGARGVELKRIVSAGGIEAARGVALKRPVPRLVLPCAAATSARESDKKSAAIRTEKKEAVLLEWRCI